MNPNSPNDTTTTGDELKIIHIDRHLKVGLVKSDNMEKSIHVKLQDWLINGVMLHDYVTVEKSPVTGELWVTDYHINNEVYAPIHNSYQTSLDDMITDNKGVPL